MMAGRAAVALLLLAVPSAFAELQLAQHRANPIRKVVTMLQEMEKQVTAEGEKEEKAFKEFMCYCKTGVTTLEQSISDGEAKIEMLTNKLKELVEKKDATEASLKEHGDSREEAKKQVAEATALRESEHKKFLQFKSDTETNMSAVSAAVAAIEKGMGGSFLQSASANKIRTYAMEKATMSDENRQMLLAFLSGSTEYAPKSGQIVGILKEMGDEMGAALKDATEAENEAKATYDEMMSAKTKEIATLTAQIEEEMMRLGELNVMLAEDGNDLEETKETVAEDKIYLAELKKGCDTKEAEWAERCKLRQEELVALHETIDMLNSDDALELFKKTLPAPAASASFVQLQETMMSKRARAMAALRAGRRGPAVDLVLLAMQGKYDGFAKVIKLIDEMLANLKQEQKDDDEKKEYCDSELDKNEDHKKVLENSIDVSTTAIEELKGAIATWTQEIADLKASIRALDKSVAEATKLRQEENTDYKELMQNDKAAKEILLWAKNRLNKFYNPKLYKPENLLQSAPQLVQIRRSDGEAAPPPPPETFGAYAKQHEENNGVIAAIDLLVGDLDKEMTEATTSEKDAQSDYEQLMSDAADKRAADSKALTDKTAAKAQAEEQLEAEEANKKDLGTQLMETMQVISNLHGECDWLLKYWEVRRAARAEEMNSLAKAKDVLNGADYSL
jgi:chromosome segregation ATPase